MSNCSQEEPALCVGIIQSNPPQPLFLISILSSLGCWCVASSKLVNPESFRQMLLFQGMDLLENVVLAALQFSLESVVPAL